MLAVMKELWGRLKISKNTSFHCYYTKSLRAIFSQATKSVVKYRKFEYCATVNSLTKQRKSVATKENEMLLVYGDSFPGKAMMCKWHSLLEQGRESLKTLFIEVNLGPYLRFHLFDIPFIWYL